MKDTIAIIIQLLGIAMLVASFILLQLPLWVSLAVFGAIFVVVGGALLSEDDTDDDDQLPY